MKTLLLYTICLLLSLNVNAQTHKTYSFKVKGSCEMCKERIEQAAKTAGAININYNLATQVLSFSLDNEKLNVADIEKAVANIGHDTEHFSSPDKTYNELPDCCHYTRGNQFNTSKNLLRGIILEENTSGKMMPIAHVNVHDLVNEFSVQTNAKGAFEIPFQSATYLSINHVNFKKDSIEVNENEFLTITLSHKGKNSLDDVVVTVKRSRYMSSTIISNQINLGTKELTKAACCNLSESFETSPTVDVSYADAVTGIKQIQLLGLAGSYTQTITENTPEYRGVAGNMGFNFIPGPWIENIQVTKGIGSVVNGYESIAGQINVELKKPNQKQPFFINGYVNTMGRMEGNFVTSKQLNDKWSTATLVHANGVIAKNDMNKDGYLDIPKGHQINIANRWDYSNKNGLGIHWILKGVSDRRIGGNKNFTTADKLTTNNYGVMLNNDALNATAKIGYIFPKYKHRSIGLILSGSYSNINNVYGLTNYKAKQTGFYSNLIYQSIINNTNHKFKTGLSIVADDVKEHVFNKHYNRKELVPGAFFEYTYTVTPNLSLIAGIREDYHNNFGWITTPRLHVKYDATNNTIFRFAVGTGFRLANIFTENSNAFISSRQFFIDNPTNNYEYGLEPEKAVNFGLSFMQKFRTNNKESFFTLDLYRTSFSQQTVVDYDKNPQEIHFYNLKGKSFSNTVMAELNFYILQNLATRIAYRFLDVQTDYTTGRLQKPLQSQHRAFINLEYELSKGWLVDFTTQWMSEKRIPSTTANPINKRFAAYSPNYFQMAAQITKKFKSGFELYVGGENLTNYKQHHLFIDGKNPFGNYFDGSLVWGPAIGAMIYTGFRYSF
ncbi:MAG TPA: TonB-dependent receptor [Chitinophagaceae bacterium]|nr:TonB-dependent receptor [Chitinophagaceae bacterium]HNJ57583.1 TonB-dependent receptor [Chitinophagaceae bacterium]HNM33265.1 TonB-dependent receptor [Chitinophagaceae bacterium]HNN30267.1 TonB-dependent receptor [Chitinophagaceae bacterium]